MNHIKSEIKKLKEENQELKNKNHEIKQDINILKIENKITQHSQIGETSGTQKSQEEEQIEQNVLNIVNLIQLKKWHTRVKIVSKDYEFTKVVLIDSGANLNCIQDGIIPTRYYSKTTETLRSAN